MELLRTLLFVPGNRERMIEKARGLSGLDAVIFDLEDAVPPAEKPVARQLVRAAVESGDFKRFRVFVRTNSIGTGMLPADLDAVVSPGLFGIVLPKVEDAQGIQTAGELLEEREGQLGIPAGHTAILPIIETVRGVLGLPSIAVHNPRLAGISYGAEDFATDLGVERSREGTEGLYPRTQIALYSHLIGVTPVDSVFSNVNDDEGLEKDTLLARQLGFRGKFLIHPKQAEIVTRVFTPSDREIAYAREVVKAFEEAEARGEASVALNGKMIDIPIVERARALLAAAQQVAIGDDGSGTV